MNVELPRLSVQVPADDAPVARAPGPCSHQLQARGLCDAGVFSTIVVIVGLLTASALADDVSFYHDVLPILSKQGCSSGACHGSPQGKGGFRLSLRAFDPQVDIRTLTQEELGRRTNPLQPEASLILRKPLMQVHHGGGLRLSEDDFAHQVLTNWIAEGCQIETPAKQVVGIEISPPAGQVLKLPDSEVTFRVTANYDDGSNRDITQYAVFSTSDESIATTTSSGVATGLRRGAVAIIVRYLEFIETSSVTFVEDVEGFVWTSPPVHNYIDELVYNKLQQLQFPTSNICTDSQFLRRVHLAIIGTLPPLEKVEQFLADEAPDKRRELIDELLDRPEYAQFWTLRWGDLLRMSEKQIGKETLPKYYNWVRSSLESNQPYHEFVRELLTAAGNTSDVAAANYWRTEGNLNDAVETTAQTFMGVRIQCAKCHNHPFERWTQNNYYGLAAFFNRLERQRTERHVDENNKKSPKVVEYLIKVLDQGDVLHPATNQKIEPWVPLAGHLDTTTMPDRRQAFADWLTAADNPFLARVEVNRLWTYVMGRGIVEPFDDFRESNPAANAELLDALAADFVKHNFDRKHILRTILNSRTFQASCEPNLLNVDDVQNGSHFFAHKLTAEQLLDALCDVLALPETFANHPAGTKATQLMAPDSANHDFLKAFGQPARQLACQCERSKDSSLAQALSLYNGDFLHKRITNKNNRFHKQLAAGTEIDTIVAQLYLTALCRPPTDQEFDAIHRHIDNKDDVPAAVEDVCWALLNCNEFLFQH